jgi:hypothetical protein
VDPPEIEFLAASPSAISTEEVSAAERAPRRVLRRVDLGVAGAAVVALIAWGVSSYSGGHAKVAAQPPRIPLPSATAKPVPDAVGAALAQYFPKATNTTVTTTLAANPKNGGTGFVGRFIEAHIGTAVVVVRVGVYQGPRHDVGDIIPTPPGLVATILQNETASYDVDVEWLAPESSDPPVDNMSSLAGDPRLEAIT